MFSLVLAFYLHHFIYKNIKLKSCPLILTPFTFVSPNTMKILNNLNFLNLSHCELAKRQNLPKRSRTAVMIPTQLSTPHLHISKYGNLLDTYGHGMTMGSIQP